MARKLHFRQLLVLVLALVYDVPQKEISTRLQISWGSVSKYLQGRKRDIPEEITEKLLGAIPCNRAAVLAVTSCLEALDALEEAGDLTDADLKEIETGMLIASRVIRDGLTRGLRRARSKPVPGYPLPADLAAHRFRAGEQLERLKSVPAKHRAEVVSQAVEFQTWALCERICEESTRQAARNVEEALAWARLGQQIAELIEGPEEWVLRLQGYALAHVANAMRVGGELKMAETLLEEAKGLWAGGADPEGVLDPGRVLDLEASLRRDQRRFEEALTLLDQAASVSRNPGRILINKGFTLEVIGEYEKAVEVLLHASSLIQDQRDGRLRDILRLNLANNFCHLGRFHEALGLMKEVRNLIAERGDKIDLIRVLWLEGRIAAGMARPAEALSLLAEARRRFSQEGISYDVALTLLEETVLLLDQNRNAEVTALAKELVVVFETKGVHREALAALQLFQEAALNKRATVKLTRSVLTYLFRARHDQGLQFRPD
jgi:tetratricopeptide (TPR) repeat protein